MAKNPPSDHAGLPFAGLALAERECVLGLSA